MVTNCNRLKMQAKDDKMRSRNSVFNFEVGDNLSPTSELNTNWGTICTPLQIFIKFVKQLEK